MFLEFFQKLRNNSIPVSLNEYFDFLKSLKLGVSVNDIEGFYYLARMTLIKNERFYDQFDRIFSNYFKSIDKIELEQLINFLDIPKKWLQKLLERDFSKKEINEIKSIGGFDELVKTLKKRLREQKKRHIGGNKWIGTSGTSSFGGYGYNPEGIRIGQEKSRHRKAIKVWDKRVFRDLDYNKELDNRSFLVALKKLRKWARTGTNEELDVTETINSTAKNGYLEIKTSKEKQNVIKILLFIDVGGSMDDYVNQTEKLFSASKSVFKNLEYFYFHNCLYENIWKINSRRWDDRLFTEDILRKYGKDFRCIFIGDASMSPYEILEPGGANEHFNIKSGEKWLKKLTTRWPSNLWINPVREDMWERTHSIQIIKKIFNDRMVPLSLNGIKKGIKILSKTTFY